MALYLLHSTVPLVRPNGSEVRHYVGWCRDGHVERRVKLHRSGRSRVGILRAFLQHGAQLMLVRVWAGATPSDEQYIKHGGHLGELCPVCSPDRVLAGDVGAWRHARSSPSSTPPSPKRTNASGGASLPTSTTVAASPSGPSPVAPSPVSTTTSGAPRLPAPSSPGGTPSNAPAPPAASTAGGSAGTKQPSSAGGSNGGH